jgi:hypothetical protein
MRNPFVGLRPFRSSEDDLFFGRARETAILRDLALTLPVLTVYAPSGTGKSSLINAGLIPAIRRVPAMIDITITDPGLEPCGFVRDRLTGNGWSPGNGIDELSLAQLLEAHYADTDHRVILVLDQFEERIKRSETLDALYAEIAKLANTRSEAATVIISIREDYLAGLDRLMRRVSGLLDAGYRVPPLSRAALTEAVFRPLSIAAGDVTVEESLVDVVLTDLEQQEGPLAGSPERQIEPGYFQVVWHRLWAVDAKAPGSVLTLASYAGEGGAAAILKSFVSRILSDLLPYEAALLQASLRYLVLPTGAKVALTVDDLMGLMQVGDAGAGFGRLLFVEERAAQATDSSGGVRRSNARSYPRPEVARILQSLFEQLTSPDAPLFRRVWRGAREEFELMHDLLGIILMEWRAGFEERRYTLMDEMQAMVTYPPEDCPSMAEAAQFVLGMTGEADAGLWEAVSDRDQHAALRLVLALASSSKWRFGNRSVKHYNELVESISALQAKLQPEAISNPDRDIRCALQAEVWELDVMRQGPVFLPGFVGPAGRIGVAGFCVLAAGIPAALVTWLAGLLSFLPNVEYLGLTMGLAAAGSAVLYGVGYVTGDRGDRSIDRRVARKALWPVPDRPRPLIGGIRLSGGALQRRWLLDWARWLLYFFLWWPVLLGSFVTASYLGAALFAALGWSPTAGFNVAALFAGLLLAVAYAVAEEL